ncbi:MAG: hypothetical protein OXH38_05850 [Chloroflexi bacterium]|nr:hypothetical protein [Chloroflexota bacterium]
MSKSRWRLVSLALLGVIGIIAGAVYAAGHGDAEVRVATMRHDDGRVEVAVQQRDADGGWGERQLPTARFLPPGVTGEWRVSSPVGVSVAAATDGMTDSAAMSTDAPAELYCVIHHGSETDPFWFAFNQAAVGSAAALGLTNIEVKGEPDVAAHAAAIDDCVERGALGVASTIPDLAGLQSSLMAARSSAFLITFNSGAEVAGLVGSTVHYGLNDRAAGSLAGAEFNAAGVTGTVLCVLHEPVNIGLSDRCDGLEDSYAGAVERVQLPDGDLTDQAYHITAGTAIATAIGTHEAAGVLVLNGALAQTATGTVAQISSTAKVGVIGAAVAAPFLVDDGALLFAIADGSQEQATHVLLALKNVDANPAARALLSLSASQAQATTTMLIRPVVLNQAYISNFPPGWRAQACALAQQFAAQLVSEFCSE